MKDIYGQALLDYFKDNDAAKLWIHNKYGKKEDMPINVYFRTDEELPDLESYALSLCRGTVLDIGAGAGSHALILQRLGHQVTAMDISGHAVAIMQQRGVVNAIEYNIFEYLGNKYDTLLLMMNGIGLCGTIQKLRLFLQHTKKLLNPGGQLLFDSSDIAYLYDHDIPQGDDYYGELMYQYAYKGKKTDWFKWLYVDKVTLGEIALQEGWQMELLFEDDMDQYLVKLTRAPNSAS